MYETIFEGVRFIEGRPAGARAIAPVRVELGGVIRSAQLKNLDDVKRIMAERVRAGEGMRLSTSSTARGPSAF